MNARHGLNPWPSGRGARQYEGLSDEEIATALKISRGTVRSQASRALGKLRSAAGEHTEENVALSKAMRPEVLYLYDLTGGDLRKITDMHGPGKAAGNAANIGLGKGMVAWSTSTKTSVRLWAVPLTGGEARQVAEHRTGGDTIDGLAVAKGAIVFSVRKGGVFSVPVDGGRVTPLDHGTGLHLLSWPWAGSPGTWSPQDGADGAPFTHLVNLETGQTDDAAPARQGQQLLACGVQSCISTTPGGARAFTRSRDGSTQQEVPPGFHIPEPPSQSRFYARNLRDDAPGLGLYDMKTGKLAAFDSGNDGTQGGSRSPTGPGG
ncbi:sigma factor-like helix-turn-helix DNA-binding protein [Streptosporangium sp. NPDC049078]|uniref:sigma factor-like helix-turn-helix DNA-binding protein n=1 Tax=Streptosporangium sp. NPDC049078 TaxID=3155767 RepID=UPI00341FA4EB